MGINGMRYSKNECMKTGVTGVILAGGQSSRMGSNKALLPYRGGRFIEAIHHLLSELCDDLLLVTNTPEQYDFLPIRMASDLFPGMGALAGIHAALAHSRTSHILAVACDMPYLNPSLIRYLMARRDMADIIIPESAHGLEPLHAIYSRTCLQHAEASLQTGRRRIVSFFDQVSTHVVPFGQVLMLDPENLSFSNINTPQEYFGLRSAETAQALNRHELRWNVI